MMPEVAFSAHQLRGKGMDPMGDDIVHAKLCSRRSFCALSAGIGFAAFAGLPLSGCGSDTTKPFRFADENGNPLEGLEVVYFRYDGSNYVDEPTILTTDKHGEVSIDMTAFPRQAETWR